MKSLSLGGKLKLLRTLNNLKQKDLSEMLDISNMAYSRYENDLRQPDYRTLSKLADYYKVTYDFLLDEYNNDLLDYELDSKSLQREIYTDELMSSARTALKIMLILDDIKRDIPFDEKKYNYLIDGLEKTYNEYLEKVKVFKENYDILNLEDKIKEYLNNKSKTTK